VELNYIWKFWFLAKYNIMSLDNLDHLAHHQWLADSMEIAFQAGDMVREALSKRRMFNTKKEFTADLVTETDIRVEKWIFDSLRRKFPEHG
jgi:fructose-1,6-bisphosphatase/inositol monophosphatase family enzyme